MQDARALSSSSDKRGYIYIDPGYHNGIACFDDKGEIIHTEIISGIEIFGSWLMTRNISQEFRLIGYERFIIDPKVDLGGDEVPASQAIGVIKTCAYMEEMEIVGIERKYKVPGYAWWGAYPYVKGSKRKGIHWQDACSIGVYDLVNRKIRLTATERGDTVATRRSPKAVAKRWR